MPVLKSRVVASDIFIQTSHPLTHLNSTMPTKWRQCFHTTLTLLSIASFVAVAGSVHGQPRADHLPAAVTEQHTARQKHCAMQDHLDVVSDPFDCHQYIVCLDSDAAASASTGVFTSAQTTATASTTTQNYEIHTCPPQLAFDSLTSACIDDYEVTSCPYLSRAGAGFTTATGAGATTGGAEGAVFPGQYDPDNEPVHMRITHSKVQAYMRAPAVSWSGFVVDDGNTGDSAVEALQANATGRDMGKTDTSFCESMIGDWCKDAHDEADDSMLRLAPQLPSTTPRQ